MPTVGVNADRSIFTWQIQFLVLHHISVTLNIQTSSKRVQPKMFSLCMIHSRLLQNLRTCDDGTNWWSLYAREVELEPAKLRTYDMFDVR